VSQGVWRALQFRDAIVSSDLTIFRSVRSDIGRVATSQGGWERRGVCRVIKPHRFIERLLAVRGVIPRLVLTKIIIGVPTSSPLEEEESESGDTRDSDDASDDTCNGKQVREVVSQTPFSTTGDVEWTFCTHLQRSHRRGSGTLFPRRWL
jgi:hypothetical protein